MRTRFRFTEGVIESVCPVHARRAFPVIIQSNVPSRLTVVIDVWDALVVMSAVIGVVDEIL